jgi:hypothetical protein
LKGHSDFIREAQPIFLRVSFGDQVEGWLVGKTNDSIFWNMSVDQGTDLSLRGRVSGSYDDTWFFFTVNMTWKF